MWVHLELQPTATECLLNRRKSTRPRHSGNLACVQTTNSAVLVRVVHHWSQHKDTTQTTTIGCLFNCSRIWLFPHVFPSNQPVPSQSHSMSTARISTMLISSLLLLATPARSQLNLSPGCYCRQGLVSGQVAGIIVGVIVFLVIAILLFGYFHTRRKERRSKEMLPTSNNMPPLMTTSDSERDKPSYTAPRKGSVSGRSICRGYKLMRRIASRIQ